MKKNNVFRRDILLTAKLAASALVAGVILTASIGSAWAYFTTYTSASGGYAIDLSNETRIEEDYSQHTKRLTVSNDGTQPVYVRAKAFSGSQYGLDYSSTTGWTENKSDGYWYYNEPLPAGATTEGNPLIVKIDLPVYDKDNPKNPAIGDTIDVVVIYESIPVQYDADGNMLSPQAADWSIELITGTTEGGNE